MVELSVLVLAQDQPDDLDYLIPVLHDKLRSLNVSYEIIIVDLSICCVVPDGRGWNPVQVVSLPRKQYGEALLAGFAASSGAFIVTMDADLSHPPQFIDTIWHYREKADLVIASRYVAGGSARMGPVRGFLSRLLNRAYKRLADFPFEDFSSGFRMYRREVVERFRWKCRSFDLLQEILVRTNAEGGYVVEVPFRYKARVHRNSFFRLLRFGWAYFSTFIRMWRLRNSVEAADYDYRAYDSRIPLQRYWQRERHHIIMSFLDQDDSIGLDILDRKIRWLSRRRSFLVRGSCDRLPFPDNSFDSVICSEVIEHVPDKPEILGEMSRVLRPGGTLILGTPDYGRWLWWVLEWIYGLVLPGAYAQEHITHFTRRTLSERLVAAGYQILDCRYVGYCEMIFKATKKTSILRNSGNSFENLSGDRALPAQYHGWV